ncbi:unnamed protein product [Arctia plantaginis]|uniref:Dedicator of cytokinesis protein 7 n=1 Tax=Arctia plantaginis TaxID=874455 RepID=A0A8S1ATE6_ARCPL|nr:unnamed protein product [Arctia plantaginis]
MFSIVQETDKLRDEDLYKFLAEIKRPSSAPKKLKCIPGTLKIEVSPCPDELKNGLTPELAKLNPYGDDNVRPCKEILPFPLHPPAVPHYQYRNLLFLSVKEINLNAYTSRTGSARNITVRIQLMSGESEELALPAIFGRSSCPEFTNEAYTTVLYHNKNPSLYDEIKIKLPADLGDQHHLLFTFLHVSCQRKPVAPDQEKNVETPVGYSWLPLCRNGKLASGDFNLPVMQEEPPANYSYISPEVLLPGTRWIDNHKPIFSITLDAHTTVHPLDDYIERFAKACEAVQEGNIPPRIGLANMEAELRTSITDLPKANVEVVARYLPVVLDKLLHLLVAPPVLAGQTLNIAQDVFTCLANLFTDISNMNEGATCDSHGRSGLITTYIQYQCTIPRPSLTDRDIGLPLPPAVMTDGSCKILHEEIALQWVVASGATRDLAMQNSWSLFELMVKSMVEYLYWSGAHEARRKARFPDQFTDDLTTLVNNVTSEIISRYGKDSRLTQSLNNSLAFFLFDLLSIMDRGYVFNLIRNYYKQMCAKIASLPDAVPLVQYKLAFLRIVCSHEHYVSLNLPQAGGAGGAGGGVSPAASWQSLGSHSSHALGHEFRSRHYLAGLLLTELTNALDLQSPVLQCAAVSGVVSLLTAHDADPRLAAPDLKARAAALYLPLLSVIMDAHPQLYRGFAGNKETLQLDSDMGQFSNLYTASSPEGEFKQNGRPPFNSETSRNLLMCLVWLLKNVERGALAACVADLPPARLHALLALIDLCFKCQEYKGRKEIMKCTQQNVRKTTDIKAKLEDVILGQGSARSDFIMRRKGQGGGGAGGAVGAWRRERWRKEWVRGAKQAAHAPAAPLPALAAALAAERALTLLHALETIVQTCSNLECGQSVCSAALQVVLRALQRNQSVTVLQHMFATVRALIVKLGWSCCGEESGICRVLLRHCAALSGATRAHASATLYALMRQHYQLGNNFSRVKMQVTMSLSSLVGTSTTFSEDSLRRALKTILVYAEHDHDLQDSNFPEQVKDLVFNLHMILSDTVKMKEFQEDPEMLLDLMHRIARGYQHSPDLRLTWLNNMAQKHMERSNHTEAGMCLVHGAALVAEQTCAGGRGAALLQRVTHNALDESCADALHHHLTHLELQALLEHAASELMTAGMYETVNEVYKVLIPIAEEHRDYKKLANIHSKLNEAFTRIEQLHGKRVFGTYFRVSFYGARFGDLDNEEFIYKEHALTKLPEIFSRLENFYGTRFGVDNVVIIKDSNIVDVSTLDPDKAYIQITYVEPYFEPHELRKRVTHYERNYNIKRFMYATPFTVGGRAHGDIAEQCKRKTILTTAHHFPYVKTRIQVVQRTQIILSPIEVAIEDIQKKINELAAATSQEPADPKMLQMVVQGCIGTTVNQGPLELAQVFLAPVAEGTQPPTRLTNKLRLAFKDFSKKCHDALRKNKNLIGSDQREYQRELERNFARFTERLAPLVRTAPGHVAQLSAPRARTRRAAQVRTPASAPRARTRRAAQVRTPASAPRARTRRAAQVRTPASAPRARTRRAAQVRTPASAPRARTRRAAQVRTPASAPRARTRRAAQVRTPASAPRARTRRAAQVRTPASAPRARTRRAAQVRTPASAPRARTRRAAQVRTPASAPRARTRRAAQVRTPASAPRARTRRAAQVRTPASANRARTRRAAQVRTPASANRARTRRAAQVRTPASAPRARTRRAAQVRTPASANRARTRRAAQVRTPASANRARTRRAAQVRTPASANRARTRRAAQVRTPASANRARTRRAAQVRTPARAPIHVAQLSSGKDPCSCTRRAAQVRTPASANRARTRRAAQVRTPASANSARTRRAAQVRTPARVHVAQLSNGLSKHDYKFQA